LYVRDVWVCPKIVGDFFIDMWVILGMVLNVLLGLCMDGHRLYTTSMVWSGHFRTLGWACHFQGLFYCLLSLICLLLRCLLCWYVLLLCVEWWGLRDLLVVLLLGLV
jgi:hypothetical protein